MKLLFFSTAAPEGGHYRSMVTIGAALQRRGNKVWIVSADGPGIRLAVEAGLETLVLPSKPYKSIEFNWKDYKPLRNIIAQHRPDVAHSFANGIPALLVACNKLGVRVTATICGGKARRIMPRIFPVIVFSEELRLNMIKFGIAEADVHLIPGRMDLRPPLRDSEVERFLEDVGISYHTNPIVFMICRADAPKQRAIEYFFKAAEYYQLMGGRATFIHIGKGKDDHFASTLRDLAALINQRVGRKILVTTDRGSDSPVKFLHLADIVVGMGRSAFEGMLLGKPTLVLSNEGFGGAVEPSQITQLMHHNFTARGQKSPSGIPVEQALAQTIQKVFDNAKYGSQIARFGQDWCSKNLMVDEAAQRYEEVYARMLSNPVPRLAYHDIAKNVAYETLRSISYSIVQKMVVMRRRL